MSIIVSTWLGAARRPRWFLLRALVLAALVHSTAAQAVLLEALATSAEHYVNDEPELDFRVDHEGVDPASPPPDFDQTTEIQFFPLVAAPRPKAGQLWSMSNSEGRVRVITDSSVDGQPIFEPQVATYGVETFPKYGNRLWWAGIYQKGFPGFKTTATILPSFLRVHATTPSGIADHPINDLLNTQLADEPEFQPWGTLAIHIEVCSRPAGLTFTEQGRVCLVSLYQRVNLTGFTDRNPKIKQRGYTGSLNADGELVKDLDGPLGPGRGGGPISIGLNISPTGQLLPEGFLPGGAYSIELDRHVHELNLDHIRPGDFYAVRYLLDAYGGVYRDQLLWGYLADPLDPEGDNSGIFLETMDAPGAEPLPRLCDQVFDDGRYENHNDGTVTDLYTGLMWQRCPVGYTLFEPGTPDDLSDDRCELTNPINDPQDDWQAALQSAQIDRLAAYDDWRVPDVKQLETLVEVCQSPLIEHLVFPDTPNAVGFWSATPLGQGSLQVDFDDGEIKSIDRAATGYARLVRSSGYAPIAPMPAISVGDRSVAEGDSGSSQLHFPVLLSTPAATEVSVDYELSSPNDHAADGVDYQSATGRVAFAPGQQRIEIPITVFGDVDAEANEYLYLHLTGSSVNARIRRSIAVGTIVDDEAIVSFANTPVQIAELDQGQSARADVPLLLDRPASTTVTVDYDLADGSGTAGIDYQSAAGSVTFDVGERLAMVSLDVIGDDLPENDETIILVLSNPLGAKLAPGSAGDTLEQTVVIVDDDGPGTYAELNDTGLVTCATDSAAALSCPQPGFPGQDAETGRDADPAANSDEDGKAGFALVKLDSNGTALVDQSDSYASKPWACAEDTVTELIWEVKTPDNALHGANWTYSWHNASGINDGGDPGQANGGACVDSTNCDTEAFVTAVNATALCGFDDWRLPTIGELYTLADISEADLKFDPDFFPNQVLTSSRGIWSSTTAVTASDLGNAAWQMNENGTRAISKDSARKVRLVRGGVQLAQ